MTLVAKSCAQIRRIVFRQISESRATTPEIISNIERINVDRVRRALRQLEVWGKIKFVKGQYIVIEDINV